MSRNETPEWYQPGDVVATLQHADDTVATDVIVDVLQYHEFDAPRERIWELVNSARTKVATEDPTEDISVTGTPRSLTSRFIDASDVTYLGTRDFAVVLGTVLSRYEGSFRVPEAVDDLAVDVFWNRQHTTVALRTISRPESHPVEKSDVETVVRGNVSPPSGRSPSILGIASNAGFTTNARSLAKKNDIELFGNDHLSQWFRDAKLTSDVLGALLEGGKQHPDDMDEVLDSLDPLPDAVQDTDPLGDVIPGGWDGQGGGGGSITTQVKQRIPVADDEPSPGTQGALYADPSDDGDFGAFDRFMDELEENTE